MSLLSLFLIPDVCSLCLGYRALFDHVAGSEQELSFKKDDILYVDDTLPRGNFGYWLAWQLDENAQRLVHGHVPSRCMYVSVSYSRVDR